MEDIFFSNTSLLFLRLSTDGVAIILRLPIFSYHLMPRCKEKDATLVIWTHVSRVAPDWDLSDALPTEL